MKRGKSDNLDFLAARLHGRRSQMAEGGGLDALCRARTLPQFAGGVLRGVQAESATQIQRRLVQELVREVRSIAAQLSSASAELLRWLAVRFDVEDLKIVVRGILTGARPEAWRPYLLAAAPEFALRAEALAAARSVEELIAFLPVGPLRKHLREAIELYGEMRRPFFFEAELDRGYFEELLACTQALRGLDQELIKPLVLQEVDTYHLMLVARGKFGYGLEATALLPLHVSGAGISRERFSAMLADPDLRTAAGRALGRALDALPPGESGESSSAIAPADLEALACNRFLRLANRAFRRSHMGLAAVVGFVELRRIEVANLITVSEGIRAQVPEEQLRARLIPRRTREAAHV
jgi:V/A-type H+/Na+-transporting ATPase subunit C